MVRHRKQPVKLTRHEGKPGARPGVRGPARIRTWWDDAGHTPPPRLRYPVLARAAVYGRPRLRADGNGAIGARGDACRAGMGDRGPAAAAGRRGRTHPGRFGCRDDRWIPGRAAGPAAVDACRLGYS